MSASHSLPAKSLAVIILNWNGIDLLRQLLPVAARCTISDEADLIVADNGSTDGSADWVETNMPGVKVIRLGDNHGFARGYNLAIARADYPYVVLLNSDVEVTPGWTVPLLRRMVEHPGTGACQPKIRSFRARSEFEYAGAAGGLIDRNGYPYCYGRLFSSVETDRGQYDDVEARPVAWASGAALMVRRDAYLALGGLDEAFFAHMEEIDLCLRMRAAGYDVEAVPASTVYHIGGASLSQGSPRKTYLNFRNNLLLLHKNLPRREGRRMLLRRRLLDTLAFGMFLLKGDTANAGAILRAHRDFRSMRRAYTSFPSDNIWPRLPGTGRNILTDFYIKRKKH